MKHRLIVLLFFMATLFVACTQESAPPTWQWHEPVRGEDSGWALAAGPEGQWVAAGLTHPGDRAEPAVLAINLSDRGELLWRYEAEVGLLSKAKAIDGFSQGGFVIAGYTVPEEAAGDEKGERSDALVIRLDESGRELWTRTWGEGGQDVALGVAALPDGGCIVTGTTRTGRPPNRQAFLLRLAPNGRELWSRTYGGPGADRGLAVIALERGGYALAGRKATIDGADTLNPATLTARQRARLAEQLQGDGWLLLVDSSGTPVAEHLYHGGEHDDAFNDLRATAGGGFVLAGYTATEAGQLYTDAWVVSVAEDGRQRWSFRWGEPRWKDEAEAVRPLADGGWLVAGRATYNVIDGQMLLLRLDESGTLLAERVWGKEQAYDQLYDVLPHPDGRTAVATGSVTLDAETKDDFTVLRLEVPRGE